MPETRAAKRKERGAAAGSKGSNNPRPSDVEQPPPKRTRATRAANQQASAAQTAPRTSTRNQKASKQAPASRSRSRNTPDTVAPAAASDQAQQQPQQEQEKSEVPPATAAHEPAPAAGDMDRSGRRGSKGEPTSSGGGEDDRVRQQQQLGPSVQKPWILVAPFTPPLCSMLSAGPWRCFWPQPRGSSWQVRVCAPAAAQLQVVLVATPLVRTQAQSTCTSCLVDSVLVAPAAPCKAYCVSLAPTLRTCCLWASAGPG